MKLLLCSPLGREDCVSCAICFIQEIIFLPQAGSRIAENVGIDYNTGHKNMSKEVKDE